MPLVCSIIVSRSLLRLSVGTRRSRGSQGLVKTAWKTRQAKPKHSGIYPRPRQCRFSTIQMWRKLLHIQGHRHQRRNRHLKGCRCSRAVRRIHKLYTINDELTLFPSRRFKHCEIMVRNQFHVSRHVPACARSHSGYSGERTGPRRVKA